MLNHRFLLKGWPQDPLHPDPRYDLTKSCILRQYLSVSAGFRPDSRFYVASMFHKIQKWGFTSARAKLAKNQLELPHQVNPLHLTILKSRPKPAPPLHSAAQDHAPRPASTEGTLSPPPSSTQSFALLNTSDSDLTCSFSSVLLCLKITMTDMEEFRVLTLGTTKRK